MMEETPSADEPLLEPLLSIHELNKQFYAGYPDDYFASALMLSLSGFHDPKDAVAPLKDATIKFSDIEGALQAGFDPDDRELEAIRLAAKLQIVALYHHTFETLTRLFLAHAPGVACPWMQLTRDEGPSFAKKARKLAAVEATWTGDYPEDEHFRLAFFPERAPVRAEIHEALSRTKSWVRLAASESLRAEPYHALKHGISVRAGTPYMALYGKNTDPRTDDNAKPVIETTGESLVLLRKDRKSGDWAMEHRGLRLSELASGIFLAQKMIRTSGVSISVR